jgi:hypothetical protein
MYQAVKNIKRLPQLFFAAVFVALCAVVVSSSSVHAADWANTEMLRNDNTFYVYLKSGENFNAQFEKVGSVEASPPDNYGVTVTVSRPGGADLQCTISAASAVGTNCGSALSNISSSETGVWRVFFDSGGFNNTARYSWSINARTGTANIPGRVWSDVYYISQSTGPTNQNTSPPSPTFWYMSRTGYQYKVTYRQYFGIDSAFTASAFGIVEPGTCTTQYKSMSTEVLNSSATADILTQQVIGDPENKCGGGYKLFFEAPAGDLPASATTWNGETFWIMPDLEIAAIDDLAFQPTTSDARSGKINFNVKQYYGSARVNIDVGNNGSYNDAEDRHITLGIKSFDEAVSLDFDGKDGSGAAIASGTPLGFQVVLEHPGEIHFVNTDAEKREGGITVERLTGDTNRQSIVYWDDRDFAQYESLRCSDTTGTKDGAAGVDSTSGVHGWGNEGCANTGNSNQPEASNNGSYGDARFIHEWTYAPTPITTAETVDLPDVYVECTAEIGSECTVDIPEFCQPDLLENPREGESAVEDGKVTYTPNGNVSEEENYVHLRESGSAQAKCFVKIKFIPKGTNTGLDTQRNAQLIGGAAAISLFGGLAIRKYGLSTILRGLIRR